MITKPLTRRYGTISQSYNVCVFLAPTTHCAGPCQRRVSSQRHLTRQFSSLFSLSLSLPLPLSLSLSLPRTPFLIKSSTRPKCPRGDVVTLEVWRQYVHPDGSVEREAELRKLIFRGGLHPDVRASGWKLLLGYRPPPGQSLAEYEAAKKKEYEVMKLQWVSVTETQCVVHRRPLLNPYILAISFEIITAFAIWVSWFGLRFRFRLAKTSHLDRIM